MKVIEYFFSFSDRREISFRGWKFISYHLQNYIWKDKISIELKLDSTLLKKNCFMNEFVNQLWKDWF